MTMPVFKNHTAYAFSPLSLANQDGQPLFVVVAKGTFTIHPKSHSLSLADIQVPVNLDGEYWGKPGESSYRYEPEVAFFKPHTDVVLLGHAQSNSGKVKELLVTLKVGELKKIVNVTGDRQWIKRYGIVNKSDPISFERMPLVYERAFGGWDRSHQESCNHSFEPRNPIGKGYRKSNGYFEDGINLPNIEDPQDRIETYGQITTPAGFGFVCPEWHPRANLAGTYDSNWEKTRQPLLPKDFNIQFMNAAPHDMIAREYLQGDETVEVTNASDQSRLNFNLPSKLPPICLVEFNSGANHHFQMYLDTLIIDTDQMQLQMLWRGHVLLQYGPLDVRTMIIQEV